MTTTPKTKPLASRPTAGQDSPPARRQFVVAVGASAGGLQALGKVLGGLPQNFAAPVLVVIHLDPSHRSHLAPLLQRETKLHVQTAKSGQRLRPGAVFVATPDQHLEVHGNTIRLTRTPRLRFSRPSIDRLFASVAKSHRDFAIGVILSGSGSDGSVGVESVKAAGGTVMVEDPRTAAFSSMPESAVMTGSVDLELPVSKMPTALLRLVNPERVRALPKEWPKVLAFLRERFGTDFAGYRTSTLKRRLERRVVATGHEDLGSYVRFAAKNRAELQKLHSDFLIKVSSFFRDPKEWAVLARKIRRPLAQRLPAGTELRAWSVGCATGQEAYSLAILFAELRNGYGSVPFKVFATDLDDGALAVARNGVYAATELAGVSPARLRRHFVKEGSRWRVRKALRANVVFGRHDLLQDTPMGSMDLVVCRNVLIYFTPEQSSATMQRLVYSLKPDGFLFLGRSEATRISEKTLQLVAGSSRIFRRRPGANVEGREMVTLVSPRTRERASRPIARDRVFRDAILQSPAVIFGVDREGRVMFWNKAAEACFSTKGPAATGRRIADLVGPSFWEGLRSATQKAVQKDEAVRVPRLDYRSSTGELRYLDLDCIMFTGPGASIGDFLFVAVDSTAHYRAEALQRELVLHLRGANPESQAVHEDAENTSQELLRLNEQLENTSEEQQTLIEELESRNEELATVNEELQSLNQELNTLNEEVGARIGEADRLNSYLRAVLDLSPQAVIGCDASETVTFWNSRATKQFRLSEHQAVGKGLFELLPVLDQPAVRKAITGRGDVALVDLAPGPGNPRGLTVGIRVIRSEAGRRQGHLFWIAEETGEREPPPAFKPPAKPRRGR